ncbi:MAG: lipocalin family protein [Maritimibacter sp.]
MTLDPVPTAGLEWWFLHGRITGSAGTRLRFMVAFFLGRGRSVGPREGALMLTHVLDENSGQTYAKSFVTPEAIALQDEIAQQVVRQYVSGAMPGLRAMGLAQHRRDLRALMQRVSWYQQPAKGPRLARAPFAASWDGMMLGHDQTRNRLRMVLPQGDTGAIEADIPLPDTLMDVASEQLDARFGPGFWYQSAPRLPLTGRINSEAITGTVWLDRQWGDYDGWMVQTTTPPHAPKPKKRLLGWDWFGLSLEDGRDILLNRHFEAATGAQHASFALLFDGPTPRALPAGFRVTPERVWRSKMTGASYPVESRIHLPDLGIEAHLTPVVDDQELPFPGGTALWEGATHLHGTGPGGVALRGHGRSEFVGYGAVLSLKTRLKRRFMTGA